MLELALPRGTVQITGTSDYASRVSVSSLKHHIAAAEKLISDTSTVLDVGANIGVTALMMAQYAPRGCVHAFEPHPDTFAQLETNITQNNCRSVRTYCYGLGDENRRSLFRDVDKFNSGNAQIAEGYAASKAFKTIDVEIRRAADFLDSVCSVDFMKIDVEGYEIDVLRGCGNRLSRVRAVFMEFNPWCLTMFRRMLPEDALEELCRRFRHVLPQGGTQRPLRTDKEKVVFLHQNMVARSLSDLICTNDDGAAAEFARLTPATSASC